MKTGDIIFVRGKGPVSDLIEIVDEGPFSHVCMAMPYNTITETQYIVNTRDIPNPYKRYEIKVVDLGLSNEERQALVNLHFKYLSYKYDLKEDFGILLHKFFNKLQTNKTWINKNELICSRYMVYLLKDVGFFKKHSYFEDVSNLTPNRLYEVLIKLKDTQPIAK